MTYRSPAATRRLEAIADALTDRSTGQEKTRPLADWMAGTGLGQDQRGAFAALLTPRGWTKGTVRIDPRRKNETVYAPSDGELTVWTPPGRRGDAEAHGETHQGDPNGEGATPNTPGGEARAGRALGTSNGVPAVTARPGAATVTLQERNPSDFAGQGDSGHSGTVRPRGDTGTVAA